jgi:hypothetical protein
MYQHFLKKYFWHMQEKTKRSNMKMETCGFPINYYLKKEVLHMLRLEMKS